MKERNGTKIQGHLERNKSGFFGHFSATTSNQLKVASKKLKISETPLTNRAEKTPKKIPDLHSVFFVELTSGLFFNTYAAEAASVVAGKLSF